MRHQVSLSMDAHPRVVYKRGAHSVVCNGCEEVKASALTNRATMDHRTFRQSVNLGLRSALR